jgi:hypothetical protein
MQTLFNAWRYFSDISSRFGFEIFRPQCVKLLKASNSDNTWLTYRNGLSSFQKFRQDHGLNNVWPCPITHIVNYVAFMFKQGYL